MSVRSDTLGNRADTGFRAWRVTLIRLVDDLNLSHIASLIGNTAVDRRVFACLTDILPV